MRYLLLVLLILTATSCQKVAPGIYVINGKRIGPDPNRKIYTSLDVATLKQIPDDELIGALHDYFVQEVTNSKPGEFNSENLSQGLREFDRATLVEFEVNNGGFDQYFYNTEGVLGAKAVSAFEFFGATELAQITREANAIFQKENEAAKRDSNGSREFPGRNPEYEPLDERFYLYEETLEARIIMKIRENPELFIGD